jgi:NDP-sugar pyrophosphorylase family protein
VGTDDGPPRDDYRPPLLDAVPGLGRRRDLRLHHRRPARLAGSGDDVGAAVAGPFAIEKAKLLYFDTREGVEIDEDGVGRFVQWLYPRQPVYTWTVPGIWYDIGSKETLEEANRIFARK